MSITVIARTFTGDHSEEFDSQVKHDKLDVFRQRLEQQEPAFKCFQFMDGEDVVPKENEPSLKVQNLLDNNKLVLKQTSGVVTQHSEQTQSASQQIHGGVEKTTMYQSEEGVAIETNHEVHKQEGNSSQSAKSFSLNAINYGGFSFGSQKASSRFYDLKATTLFKGKLSNQVASNPQTAQIFSDLFSKLKMADHQTTMALK